MARGTHYKRFAKDYGTLLTDFTTNPPTDINGNMTNNETSTEHVLSGSASWHQKLVHGAGNTVGQVRWNQALDLRQVAFVDVWIYDNSGNTSADLGSDIIFALYGENNAFGNAASKSKWALDATAGPGAHDFGGKWKLCRFKIDSPIVENIAGQRQFVWWMLEIDNRASADVEIWIDCVRLGQRSRPKFVWMFDDGSDSDYAIAYPYLAATGHVGTSFVISETMAGGGEMTLAQAQEMYAAGWDIANHSNNGDSLTSVSVAEAVAKYETCRDYLIANGMPRAATYLAYPNNSSSSALNTALTAAGCEFGRTVAVNGTNQDIYPTLIGHPDDDTVEPFSLIYTFSADVLNENDYSGDSGAAIKANLLEAAKQGAIVCLSTHKILTSGASTPTVNEASFNAMHDWAVEIEQAGIWDIVPLSEVMAGISRADAGRAALS